MWVFFWKAQMASSSAQVQIDYGSETGSVAFIDQANHLGWEEPLFIGPLSFRATPSKVWVADSCGGRVFQFGVDGRKIKGIKQTIELPASISIPNCDRLRQKTIFSILPTSISKGLAGETRPLR